MVEKLKININKIFIALTLMLTLIGITFINTKTYAFTIDNNGNLVGDNLFDYTNINNYELIGTDASSFYSYDNGVLETTHNSWFRNIGIKINLQANTTYTISAYSYANQGNSFIRMSSNNPDGTDLGYINFTNNNEYTYGYFTFTTTQDNNVLSIGVAYNGNTTGYFKNIMLNEGNTPKQYEPFGIWYSEFNYDTLENNYNELYNYNKYGWLRYIDNLDLSIGGTFIEEFNFNELVSNNYITNNKINVYDLSRLNNQNYTYSNIEIYFNDSIKNLDTFNYNLFSLSSNGDYASSIVSIYDSDDHVATFEFSNEIVVITPQDIMNKNKLFNGNIYNISIYNSSPDSAINYYTDSNYGNGYQSGYNYGRTIADSIERELNNKIKEKDNQINQLEIEKQQAYNNGYTTGYNEGNTNSNGLYNMVIAVADTPISIFKQIFNFNILGLDISGFIFGIISLLIIIWLIKKII